MNCTFHPGFLTLHRCFEGANQKCCSFKGTKKLWRQGHRSGTRLFPLRLPGGRRLSEFILEVGTPSSNYPSRTTRAAPVLAPVFICFQTQKAATTNRPNEMTKSETRSCITAADPARGGRGRRLRRPLVVTIRPQGTCGASFGQIVRDHFKR